MHVVSFISRSFFMSLISRTLRVICQLIKYVPRRIFFGDFFIHNLLILQISVGISSFFFCQFLYKVEVDALENVVDIS